MRKRCWWRSATLSAAMMLGTATSGALAQNDVTAPYVDAPYAPAAAATDEAAELRMRIDQLGREVADLRTQLRDQTQTKSASLSAEADAAADAAADAPKSPLKKVDTITKPTVTVGGRIYFDHIMFEDDTALVGIVDRLNETGFNTARIEVKGNAWENVVYQVEVEFEGTETDFKDTYMGVTNAPILGNVLVGHFKEPFSLEEITSSRYITFMQRSTGHGAFVPSRNYGLMAFDYIAENDMWSWYAGTFRHDSPDNPTGRASHIADNGDWTFTGRLAGLLWYGEPSAGRYLVHVGTAYSYRSDLTVVSFANRPELGSQAGYLTSTWTGDRDWNLYGAEAAIVWGPSHVQAEYYLADVDGGENAGAYIEFGYFLTGEHRGYRKDRKCFDRVKPLEDFFRVETADGVCMGSGAWQLKARFSWVDLDEGVAGIRGSQDDISAGVNWHWNPYTRMMFDWVHEDVDLITGVSGENDNFGMRFQVDF